MSIDMFEHLVNRAAAASCGLPGDGFKVTSDGNYVMDRKRLCNVQDSEEQFHAVNLRFVSHIVLNEIRTLYQVTSYMRHEIDNHNILMRILEELINEKLKNV